ncbi:hypothetical protein GCM10027030_13200 [Luteococcus sediminum]
MTQASYQGPDGKRHNAPTTFQTKGDANTWLSMQSAAITEHRWKPAAPKETAKTLAEFTERWLAGRATGAMGLKPLSPRTVAEYERMSKSFTGGALGAKALPKVTSADVRAWHAAQDPSKATTRAHTYALLRTVLNSAVEEELIPDNPRRSGEPAPRSRLSRSSLQASPRSSGSRTPCRSATGPWCTSPPGAPCATVSSPSSGARTWT